MRLAAIHTLGPNQLCIEHDVLQQASMSNCRVTRPESSKGVANDQTLLCEASLKREYHPATRIVSSDEIAGPEHALLLPPEPLISGQLARTMPFAKPKCES